jgi:hypothetical protein
MKIGFDAKWFFSGNPSGKAIVTNILKHLLEQNINHDFYVFLKSDDKSKQFPFWAPNVHLIYVWGKISLLSNIF